MKIRTGFVSNSSTSSFIFLGVKKDYKSLKDLEDIEKVSSLYILRRKGNFLVGKYLANFSDEDYLEDEEESFSEELLIALLCEIQKYFPEVDKDDIKIFKGTM